MGYGTDVRRAYDIVFALEDIDEAAIRDGSGEADVSHQRMVLVSSALKEAVDRGRKEALDRAEGYAHRMLDSIANARIASGD